MSRLTSLVTALLFAAVAVPALAAEGILADQLEPVATALVSVLPYDKDQNAQPQFTGLFVAGNQVVTTRHLLIGAEQVVVRASDGKGYRVLGVSADDPQGDLVLLKVDIPDGTIPPVKLATALPKQGQTVYTIGNTFGHEWVSTEGVVATLLPLPPAMQPLVYITPVIAQARSGGALLDSTGQVLGIAHYQTLDGEAMTIATIAARVGALAAGEAKPLTEWNAGKPVNWLTSSEGLATVGTGIFLKGDVATALRYYQKAAVADPKSAEAWYLLGHCYGVLSKWTEAELAFREAVRLNPKYLTAQLELGEVLYNLGRYDDAVKTGTDALALSPDNAQAYSLLGRSYTKLEKYDEALKACQEAVRLFPNDPVLHRCLGAAYQHLGMTDRALEEIATSVALEKQTQTEKKTGTGKKEK